MKPLLKHILLSTLALFLSQIPVGCTSYPDLLTSNDPDERSPALCYHYPKYFKDNGQPTATVGALIYAHRDGHTYILLARQTTGSAKGTYSEFSGSAENDALGNPQSFGQGALRECQEESAGLYKYKFDSLNKWQAFYHDSGKREEFIVFIPAEKMYQNSDFQAAQLTFSDNVYKEKDDFQWVKVTDVLNDTTSLNLRNFFQDYLKKDSFRQLLMKIQSRSEVN